MELVAHEPAGIVILARNASMVRALIPASPLLDVLMLHCMLVVAILIASNFNPVAHEEFVSMGFMQSAQIVMRVTLESNMSLGTYL